MILIRLRGRSLDRVGQLFEAYGLMGSWTPALRAALASGLSMVARVAPSRSASSSRRRRRSSACDVVR